MSTDVRPAYRIGGASVPREAFYRAACDPRRSVSVEACAGAGKTWMLVSRILRALLDGAEPQEILAITFTRKAAGEMRARLSEWLLAFSDVHCDATRRIAELRARGLDADEARALEPALGSLYERVLASGRKVEVRTFHAWFSQLLRAAPLALLGPLGLQPDMEVVDDLAEHRGRIQRRFHAAVLADAALKHDYEALVRDRGRNQVQRWLDAAWDKRIEIELADAAGTLESSVPPAAVHWPEHAALAHPADRVAHARIDSVLRELAVAMARQLGKICQRQGALLALAMEQAEARARFASAHAALHTQEGAPRRHIDAPGLAEALVYLGEIQRACAQQSGHEEHLRMVRLSRVLLRETAAYKRQRGLADMGDLERCALALLRDDQLSGWVQQRLDLRVRHVLIDEFQDTSPLQWQALLAWLSGYAGAGGGTSGQRPPGVFIVGDPKQSIYRFRRAEPRVFEGARAFVVEGLGGQALACDHTRRNAPEVLGVLNPVFEEAQQQGEFAGFRRHTTEIEPLPGAGVSALGRVARPDIAKAGAVLDVWRDSLTEPREEVEERIRLPEARRVASAVQRLIVDRGYAPGDIHVLCRKRESLGLVADRLAALHVPFAAADDQVLLGAAEARDLLAVLDVLVSPQHALSLAHALRSPLFGARDEDLVELSQAARDAGGWWQALQHGGSERPALRRAAGLLARWHAAARTLPPHDLLDRIVAEGDLHARVAAAVPPERRAAALAAIDALLGLALTLDGARYATPYNFVRALKRRAVTVAAPARPDAVQLLTIHGAKGLEARAVFVMDADPERRAADSATLLVDWPVASGHPRCCAFVYSETFCPPSLEPVRDVELAARRREELNALYVAMSRARERLVFSATEPFQAPPETSWWQRVEGRAERLEVPAEEAHAATAADKIVITELPPGLAPLTGDPSGTATASASSESDRASVQADAAARALADDDRRPSDASRSRPRSVPPDADDASSRLGQAVHRVLEWKGADADAAMARLADGAAREFGADPAEVARLASRIWESPACARFFRGAGLRWSGNEVGVADRGEALRIDRLVELANADGPPVWWVLDYKLGHAPERLVEHREQLLRYRRIVEALRPGATVRCAFITGEGAVVEVAAPAGASPEQLALFEPG